MKIDLKESVIDFEGNKIFMEKPARDSFGQPVKVKDANGQPIRNSEGNFIYETKPTELTFQLMISEVCGVSKIGETGEGRAKLGNIMSKVWSGQNEVSFTEPEGNIIMEQATEFARTVLWFQRLREKFQPEAVKAEAEKKD